MATTLSWKFPETYFLRIELFFVGILALIIFLISWWQFAGNVVLAIALTGMFLGIYLVVSHGGKQLHPVEHHYLLNQKHFHVTRTQRQGSRHDKVPLSHWKQHKLDRFFLGGYMVTKKGRKHLLYFNTKRELVRFEQFLKKHLKPVR